MRFTKTLASALALAAVSAVPVAAKDLNSVGISVGLLGNPFFVATIKGIEDAAKKINPNVKVTSVSADYDLNKQVSQIDSFVAAGVDIIMLNAVDAQAIGPAVKRATDAGVIVAAFDVSAPGATVTVAPGADTSKAPTTTPASVARLTAGAMAWASTAFSMMMSTPAATKLSIWLTCLFRS